MVTEKPADKVEPKFKVGDWVMVDRPVLITKVEDMPYNNHQYWTSDGTWFGDGTEAKLWTIQDAKDGDVLSYRDGQWCFIYKGIATENTFKYYALLSEKGVTVNDAAFSLLTSCITPATKEQRDLLFQKMKDAGYEWDADKKELKEIEQKHDVIIPKFRIGDTIRLKNSNAEHIITDISDGYYRGKGWVLDIIAADESNDYELVEKSLTAWSEEDERFLNVAINILNSSKVYTKSPDKYEDTINWLKSLRPQTTWKPSDEQIEALDEVYKTHGANNVCRRVLFNLMNDLKKLKE